VSVLQRAGFNALGIAPPSAPSAPVRARRPVEPRISVVIPALNEALNLPHVLPKLPRCVDEVVLVNGCSTDGTEAVARALRPDVRIVHQTGRGKGDALRCGFAASSGDVIVTFDADGSARADEIDVFIEMLRRGADVAKGSRYLLGGGSADFTWLRRIGNAGLSAIVNVLFRTRYTDLCYGYNAFWADCLPFLDVDCDGFEVETLINIRAAAAGLAVVEVPSFEEARIHGASNLKTFRDGLRVVRTIVRERFRRGPHGRAAGAHAPTPWPVSGEAES
jgi:glycosyltransferase involved in cell wall biosynthesis